ncbi:hypothetical protein GCM10022422_16760 [Flavobacterium ginsengisoli]|uniref:Uncharacterized protein n=1 Tax=Flavobacterium ginsengisoli TaxID=871694 RepID=A0ABP7FA43_9FLAO
MKIKEKILSADFYAFQMFILTGIKNSLFLPRITLIALIFVLNYSFKKEFVKIRVIRGNFF